MLTYAIVCDNLKGLSAHLLDSSKGISSMESDFYFL